MYTRPGLIYYFSNLGVDLMPAEYFPCATDAQRIKRFKRAGVINSRIAEILRVSLEDLEKHYPFELGFTDEEDLATIAEVAFNLAKSGEEPSMTKWWLQIKGGWIYDENAGKGVPSAPMLIILDREIENDPDGFVIDGEFSEDQTLLQTGNDALSG